MICLPRLRFEGPGLSPQSALVLCGTTNLQRFGGGGGWSAGTAFRRRIFFDLDFLARFGVCVGFFLLFGFRFTSAFFCAVSPNQPFMRLLHPSFFPLSSISFFHGRRGIVSLTALGSDEKDKLL